MQTSGAREKPRYRWLVLAVSLLGFIAYAFAFQSCPPLMQSIKFEFALSSDAEAALLMSIVLLPGIFSLPASLWINRLGSKRVGSLSLLGVVASSIIAAFSNSFLMLLVARLVLGISATFIVIVTPAVVTEWFAKEDLGIAMGIFNLNFPLATIVAFPVASLLLQLAGWRFPFFGCALLGAIAVIAYLAVAKPGPYAVPAEGLSKGSLRKALTNKEIWKLGAIWGLFNSCTISFSTWGPTLFEHFQHFPKIEASVLASLPMYSSMICLSIYGYASDRFRRRKPFILTGFLLMICAVVLISLGSGNSLVFLILFYGASAAMVPGIVFALPSQVLGPAFAAIGFGIEGTMMNIGAGLAQPTIGFVIDATSSYIYPLVTMAGFAAMGAIVACTLKTR
jgi:predicted MFS family arabinose efflux permease